MNIHRIEVPAPMEIGDVNCYFIESDELVLVDPGPADEETFRSLESGLDKLGYAVQDIDSILITHPHSDHFGNAHRLKQVSGAEIYAHRGATEFLENFQAYGEKMEKFFRPYLLERGVPEEEINTVVNEGIPNQFGTSLEVDHVLEGGKKIVGSIDVIETPGHSRGSLSFLIDGDLIAGDTVIKGMTPNPTLQLPENGEVPSSLELYLETLGRLKQLDVDIVYGGHREPVENLEAWIDETMKHHEKRKDRILEILDDGDKTAFEVMKILFEGIETETYFLGMSEVIAHVKLLESEEKVEKYERDGIIYYSSS